MGKKYSILKDEKIEFNGHTLYRIKAEAEIPYFGVQAGEIGGYVESEDNLSQEGACFVRGDAKVYGHSKLDYIAIAEGKAVVKNIASDAGYFSGNSIVFADKDASIYGNIRLEGVVTFDGEAKVYFENGDKYSFGDDSEIDGDFVMFIDAEDNEITVKTSTVYRDVFNFNFEE